VAKRRRWAAVAGGAAVVAVVGLLVAANGETGAGAKRDLAGTALEMSDGSQASLGDYRGRPLVVNLFASYCPEGAVEMQALEEAHEQLGDQVAFLGVNVQDTPEGRQSMLDATGITYDVAVDETGDVFTALGAVTMPSTVFIDADGRVADVHGGALPPEALQAGIDELVGS